MAISADHYNIIYLRCYLSQVYIEDNSQNGTFINGALYKISRGERTELKSGDEIFLVNPRRDPSSTETASFLFINMRERLTVRRPISSASVGSTSHQIHIEDDYIIGDEIGSGMCGVVHECIHRASGVHYAVKIIDTRKFTKTPGLSVQEIREEANMMKTLDHPNIIRIQDTYETEHWIFIVMEYLRGGDLFDRIIERERFAEAMARDVMIQILNAVDYLHTKDICHRDLKPGNKS